MTETRNTKQQQREDEGGSFSNVTAGNNILRNHSWSQAFDSEEGEDGNESGLLRNDSRSVIFVIVSKGEYFPLTR